MTELHSRRTAAFANATRTVFQFISESSWSRRRAEPGIADFVLGNPHELPLPGFVEALQRGNVPQNKDWYAYKNNERPSQELIAASLQERYKQPFEPDDIFMTNGAFAALSVTLSAVTDPDDEVIFISPPWFFYEALIVGLGATPVRVKVNLDTFDLDLDAIALSITSKTRAIIINSPNNPTGKIYPPETLEALGRILTAASERHGRTLYLLSDEAYSRIIFDGNTYYSPTTYYPNSFLLYTYGKTLLTPGQRMGYIALPPTMPNRESMRFAILSAQFMTGFAFPNALLQHALPDLERLSIDIAHLQRKRDRLVSALRNMGYELHSPEGTFYLLVRSPLEDDGAFLNLLAEFNVFCLPGTIAELPGYFRISLTANDEMIDRAIPGFEAAIQRVVALKTTR